MLPRGATGLDRPILGRQIEEYLVHLTPPRPALVREMEELASQRRFPIVVPLVGALLEVLSRALDARRVLELGSGFGYSV